VKKSLVLVLVLVVGALGASTWYIGAQGLVKFFDLSQPDLPPGTAKDAIGMERYLQLRNEHLDMLRGFDTAKQDSREKSIREMEQSEAALAQRIVSGDAPQAGSWVPLGPAPIPIGASNGYSGRVSAIAVHPTNPDTVYVGTSQGGLYRSLNGGTTWTPLMDSALTLAIGAVAIAPSDPTTLYVGTGESTLCGTSCHIGVGLYRISNADTSPVLTGPLNKDSGGFDVFGGRAISEVLIHPTDINTVFVSTTTGTAGIGSSTAGLPLPTLGVYRSTNAAAANPTFTLLNVAGTTPRSYTDMVMEPGNPSRIYVGAIGTNGVDGGVYTTANALDASPTFTQLLSTPLNGNPSRVELAANKVGATTTVIAASGEGTGTVWRSVDAAPFALLVDNNFCNPQCFYDIAVAIDPNDANRVYLGGSPTRVFGRSADGGTNYTNSSSGLHVDTQAFAIAPSNPSIFYFGSDGGMWKTNDVSATPVVWNTLNNTTLHATQFMSIALHPLDRNYSLGGTQDNGTEYLAPNGTLWVNSDGGDGGFVVIDKTTPSTSTITAYHTYFNSTGSQIGFSRATTVEPNGDPFWAQRFGCGSGWTANGINCADAVLFYAPMVGGPVAADSAGKNTLYFGTNRVYRSADTGVTMADVSGTLPARVSAIAIAPQDDNIRLAGTTSGGMFLSTTAGATTMANVTGSIPARYVGRIAIDPTNANAAYVALNGFGIPNQHVWKTTNLLSGTPTWVAAGTGIPDTPTNTLAIDPANTQIVYAGTDIGVFRSSDGGASWIPLSNGLPRVAVFGMEIQPVHRVLRIATHGRGMYEFNLNARTTPVDFDGDNKTDLSIFRPAVGEWFYQKSSDGVVPGFQFGVSTDKIVPGDYTGDGKTDIAIWRPSNGFWFILRSEDFLVYGFPFGTDGDVPVPGDYDGDGKTDAAVFRPSTVTWIINKSSGGVTFHTFGAIGDKPVVADYDGDGKTDIAIYRPSVGEWYYQRSSDGVVPGFQFGSSTDKPVQGDYTGDGKADIAFWRPSTGFWYVLRSEDFLFYGFPWGLSTDLPAPGDFDGDGKMDASVFRPSDTVWYINRSTAGVFIQQFGIATDQPVQGAFVP
jgi:hypothetical protein